jgi:hypothetical protein
MARLNPRDEVGIATSALVRASLVLLDMHLHLGTKKWHAPMMQMHTHEKLLFILHCNQINEFEK